MGSYPMESVMVKGKEYINLKSEVFHFLFLELMNYTDVDKAAIDEVNKMYSNAKKIKRKRIRLKREKQALLWMYNILEYRFIK